MQEKNEEHTSESTYVAFLDILGFKELVTNNTHEELKHIYNVVIEKSLDKVANGLEKGILDTQIFKADVNFLTVSDSIIIWTDDDSYASFVSIVISVWSAMAEFFIEGIPLRGSITMGPLTTRSTSRMKNNGGTLSSVNIFGKSLVNAYKLESEQEWSGCIIDNKCIEKFNDDCNRLGAPLNLIQLEDMSVISLYTPPKKKGSIEQQYVVGYPTNFYDLDISVIRHIFGKFNKNADNWAVERKVLNTALFFSQQQKSSGRILAE